jgi:peptidyl-prolyl cis-trans isomerase D
MLKSMRKNLKQLAPALWFVIAAFIISIFAVWGGAGRLGEGGGTDTLVSVGKEKITGDQYFQMLRQQLEQTRSQYKDLDANLIQQLNIPQQALEQMIQRKVILQTAANMGIRSSDKEIRDKIISYPVFQKDGKFVGFQQYEQILSWNRISIGAFESSLAEEIKIEKTIKVITAGITVTEDEVWENFKNTNESAKLEYAVLDAGKIELSDEPEDEELKSFFEANKDDYKLPEKREGSYVFFNTEDLKVEISVSDGEIIKYYDSNLAQFTEPEKTRVSRIFIPSEGKDPELVKAELTAVHDRVEKGEDFGDLASKFSKDRKAAEKGDWGLYEWKSLAQTEQDAVSSLNKGETSDLIELEDGVSLLKVTEKEAEITKPLEEVRSRITTLIKDQKARAEAEAKAAKLEKSANKQKDLKVAADNLGYKIDSTGLLKEGEALTTIDPSGSLSRALFALEADGISSAIFTYSGVGLAQLKTIDPPRPATFEEVRDAVKESYLENQKKSRALETVNKVKAELGRSDLETLSEKYAMEYKTVDEHKRGMYLSTMTESREVDDLSFSLPLNEASDPISYDNGYAILRVLDRKTVTREEFEEKKKAERETTLENKRSKFFLSFMNKAREDLGVKIKYDMFLRINADVLSRFGGQEE